MARQTRIKNRRVTISKDEKRAYCEFDPELEQRHPDAAYTVPHPREKGRRVSVILLGIFVLCLVLPFLI